MSLDEQDSKKELAGSDASKPQAVLTPESMAQSAHPSWEMKRSVTKTEETAPQNYGSGLKTVILASVGMLLLAGIIVTVVLAANGSLFKGKKKLSQEAGEQQAVKETTVKPTTDPSTATPTPEPGPIEGDGYISDIKQITSSQYKEMHDAARHALLSHDMDDIGLPDEVTIDEMNYLGAIRKAETSFGSSTIVEMELDMVYQVQVTDKTGAEPVKRQFFCSFGFPEVYQSGYVNSDRILMPSSIICFGNWSVHGCLDLDRLIAHVQDTGLQVAGGTVDESKLIPFEGKDPIQFEHHKHAKKLEQLTDQVLELYRKQAGDWMSFCLNGISELQGKQNVGDIEYVGIALTASPTENKNLVYIVYRWTVTDLEQDPPESKNVYWYVSFEDCIADGEIYCGSIMQNMNPMSPKEWVNYGMTNMEDLRAHLAGLRRGWTYEDNFVE